MKATVLDTVTGKTAVADGPRSWEWAENNWSCDCNRWNLFPELEEEQLNDPDFGVCKGGKRFLVVAAEFNRLLDEDGGPIDYDYTLAELNSDYPDELLRAHGIL